MKKLHYAELLCCSPRYWGELAFLVFIIMVGMGGAYYMEHHGHYVTGMSNHIVWGLPHVFAIFLIVAASGALNVASIGSGRCTSRWGAFQHCWPLACWRAGWWCCCSTWAARTA